MIKNTTLSKYNRKTSDEVNDDGILLFITFAHGYMPVSFDIDAIAKWYHLRVVHPSCGLGNLTRLAADGIAIATVALTDRALDPSELNVISHLRQRDITVIAYADGVNSWPIGVRCRVLLAGAKHLLDAGMPMFEELLSQALGSETAALRQRRAEAKELWAIARRHGLLGDSGAMLDVTRQIVRFSELSNLPVMITGESGTGKELVASAIKALDPRRRGSAFIPVNCAAIAASLAESELFGNVKGAFTGAISPRKGYFLAAHNGTLFLDEVGELSLDLQAKLLRVIEEKQVWQVGADHSVPTDVRVIAATNRDIPALIKARLFREDLFYRLNILTIGIAPLRERPEDLRPLAEHFIATAGLARENTSRRLDPELIDALALLPLYGNARELRNLIVAAAATKVGDGPICLGDLAPALWQELCRAEAVAAAPPALDQSGQGGDHEFVADPIRIARQHGWKLNACLAHCEREIVEAAMQQVHHNQSQAARLLGLTPRSIYNKLRKYHLSGREIALN